MDEHKRDKILENSMYAMAALNVLIVFIAIKFDIFVLVVPQGVLTAFSIYSVGWGRFHSPRVKYIVVPIHAALLLAIVSYIIVKMT